MIAVFEPTYTEIPSSFNGPSHDSFLVISGLYHFVDVEGTKDVKRLINLLAITDQFIP